MCRGCEYCSFSKYIDALPNVRCGRVKWKCSTGVQVTRTYYVEEARNTYQNCIDRTCIIFVVNTWNDQKLRLFACRVDRHGNWLLTNACSLLMIRGSIEEHTGFAEQFVTHTRYIRTCIKLNQSACSFVNDECSWNKLSTPVVVATPSFSIDPHSLFATLLMRQNTYMGYCVTYAKLWLVSPFNLLHLVSTCMKIKQ